MNSDSVKELNHTTPAEMKNDKNCNVEQRRQTRKLYSSFVCVCVCCIFFYFFHLSLFVIITITIIVHHLKFSLRNGINYYASLRVPHTQNTSARIHFVCACLLILLHALYDHLRALHSSFNRIRIFLFSTQFLALSSQYTTPNGVQLPFMCMFVPFFVGSIKCYVV